LTLPCWHKSEKRITFMNALLNDEDEPEALGDF